MFDFFFCVTFKERVLREGGGTWKKVTCAALHFQQMFCPPFINRWKKKRDPCFLQRNIVFYNF